MIQEVAGSSWEQGTHRDEPRPLVGGRGMGCMRGLQQVVGAQPGPPWEGPSHKTHRVQAIKNLNHL